MDNSINFYWISIQTWTAALFPPRANELAALWHKELHSKNGNAKSFPWKVPPNFPRLQFSPNRFSRPNWAEHDLRSTVEIDWRILSRKDLILSFYFNFILECSNWSKLALERSLPPCVPKPFSNLRVSLQFQCDLFHRRLKPSSNGIESLQIKAGAIPPESFCCINYK